MGWAVFIGFLFCLFGGFGPNLELAARNIVFVFLFFFLGMVIIGAMAS